MNKKLEWDLTVLTDYVMGGNDAVSFNKEEMRTMIHGTIKAIDKAKINGGIVGFGLGVGCCSVIAYYMNQNQKKNRQVESK